MYKITSVPQVNLRNKTTPVQIGNLVGGSSAINALMSVRGSVEDYDRWGQFFSNSSEWSWEGLLPYFEKALNFVPPDKNGVNTANIAYDISFWGNTSDVYASWPNFQYPGVVAEMESFKHMPGVEFPPDSGSGQPGVFWFPQFMNPATGNRSYARTGHYLNVKRPNYTIITGMKVFKVIFNETTATGVSCVPVRSGRSGTFTARKEVILAAGAVHTPQILQLSGIGPEKLLASANITTIVDLPGVGQNFQDHPMLSSQYSCK